MNSSVIKKDFPLFDRNINGKPITYLDSTATALKPKAVIDAMNHYYTQCTANVFRGIYTISEEATTLYEAGRSAVAQLIHVDASEIVFVRNATEALNLIGYSWFMEHVGAGDNVVTTIMEHHSNFVTWQQHAKESKAEFRMIRLTSDGLLDLSMIETLVDTKTKLFAITAVSNVLGTINPIEQIVAKVKSINPQCFIVVDAAQAVPHMPVDVHAWGADAVAFSSHKMLGPSGMGALWAKKAVLEQMKPFMYGGDMIREVHETETIFNDVPHKFEAGTPFIEGAMGFGAAATYLKNIGMDEVREHEKEITAYALTALQKISGIKIVGPLDPNVKAGVIAFQLPYVHPHDIAEVVNEDNVCIRVGFHCAEPLHEYLGIGPTARASFYIYNDHDDVDALIAGLEKVEKLFK